MVSALQHFKEAAVKKILVICLLFMGAFAFAKEEVGYVYFRFEVLDTPWTGYVPPNAQNLEHMVCLDITFKSNLPKEYTDYFVDLFENQEINTGLNHKVFGGSRKSFALFTRTADGFISRRPFAKKWDHPNGAWDTPNLGSYESYREGVMQQIIVNSVQFILNTGGDEKLSAQAAGDTSLPDFWDDLEQGFRFRTSKLFERKWIIYKE
jgi:hypothetical protein